MPNEGETPVPNACAPGLRAEEGKEAVVKEVLEEQVNQRRVGEV